MCISVNPSKMSSTIIYAGESKHPENGRLIHVMAYQNTAKTSGPNAMILPIPTREELTADNMIDLSGCKNLLKDYAKQFHFSRMLGFTKFASRSIQIFDKGSYTTITASRAQDILQCLPQVPEKKRPNIDAKWLKFFLEHYPETDWKYTVSCWDGEIEAEPIAFWYYPTFEKYLFLPGLDAHDGELPDLNEMAKRDHTLVIGNPIGLGKGNHVPEELRKYFNTRVIGGRITEVTPNIDWFYSVENLKKEKIGAWEENFRYDGFLSISPPYSPEYFA